MQEFHSHTSQHKREPSPWSVGSRSKLPYGDERGTMRTVLTPTHTQPVQNAAPSGGSEFSPAETP